MDCYDCAGRGQRTTASATCRRCGAAVCTDHARERSEEVPRPAAPGATTTPVAARRITCPTCSAAENPGQSDT